MALVELLIAAGADPSARNGAGRTAADWARRRGMTEVARRLDSRDAANVADEFLRASDSE
jgi:ankyrin repeat protein